MQTIIIAVLVLLVLGILAYLLIAKGFNPFTRGLGQCKEKGGNCIQLNGQTCEQKDPNYPVYGFKGCYAGNQYQKDYVCCFPAG